MLTPSLWLPILLAERKELDRKIRACRNLVNYEEYQRERQAITDKREQDRLRQWGLWHRSRLAWGLHLQMLPKRQIAIRVGTSKDYVDQLLGRYRRTLRHPSLFRLEGMSWVAYRDPFLVNVRVNQ